MTIYYTYRYKELNLKSHELLQIAIGDYIGDEARAVRLVEKIKTDYTKPYEGKPYIEGFDKFSISHSDNAWAVLIDKRECGFDVQYERSCDYHMIAHRFFNPEDAALVGGAYYTSDYSSMDPGADFFRIWTKREALVKALGLSVVDDDFPAVGLRNSVEFGGKIYYVKNVDMPDAQGLYAAICIDASENINEKLLYKEIYANR